MSVKATSRALSLAHQRFNCIACRFACFHDRYLLVMLLAGRDEATDTRKRHRRVRAVDTDSATNASTNADGADDQYEYYDSITTKAVPGTTTTSLIAEKPAMPKMVKIKEPEVIIDVVSLIIISCTGSMGKPTRTIVPA